MENINTPKSNSEVSEKLKQLDAIIISITNDLDKVVPKSGDLLLDMKYETKKNIRKMIFLGENLKNLDDAMREPILEKVLQLLERFGDRPVDLHGWIGGDIPYSAYIFEELSKRVSEEKERSEISGKTQLALEGFRDDTQV